MIIILTMNHFQIAYSFLAAGGAFIVYIVPAYYMAGFHQSDGETRFYTYIGYMLLYLYATRAITIAASCVFDSRHTSAMVTGIIMTVAALGSGFTVHPKVRNFNKSHILDNTIVASESPIPHYCFYQNE